MTESMKCMVDDKDNEIYNNYVSCLADCTMEEPLLNSFVFNYLIVLNFI